VQVQPEGAIRFFITLKVTSAFFWALSARASRWS
jgi:hypothetical protein